MYKNYLDIFKKQQKLIKKETKIHNNLLKLYLKLTWKQKILKNINIFNFNKNYNSILMILI